MRYTLRNSSPSDPGILVHDGGFILAGSRADAERLVYDNQKLWEAASLCRWYVAEGSDSPMSMLEHCRKIVQQIDWRKKPHNFVPAASLSIIKSVVCTKCQWIVDKKALPEAQKTNCTGHYDLREDDVLMMDTDLDK